MVLFSFLPHTIPSSLMKTSAARPTQMYTDSNFRFEFLSPGLVRIEEKGPEGFEDRVTFNVSNRKFSPTQVTTSANADGKTYETSLLKVLVPSDPSQKIEVENRNGKVIYSFDKKMPAPQFLPAPSSPADFVMPDSPRLIPPPWGATPELSNSNYLPATSGWDTSNDSPDVYVFVEPNYADLRTDYLNLCGHTELPPLFTFGFWNSRWFPYSESTALDEINQYRKRKIPLDLFTLDTNWRVGGSHGYAVDQTLFPNMKRFMSEAHGLGVKIMFNDHPEPVGAALSPKELSYRQWGLDSQFANGLDVWWFDRNWSTHLGQPMPKMPLEVWGMRLYHDMTQAYYPNRRPLIMTNAQGIDNGFADYAPNPAAHRYPIWWTGDTQSTFEFLQRAVANCLNQGVETLCPYIHDDLGGHIGPPTPELYTRYLEYGCLSPVTRVHCTFRQTRLPWDFGPNALKIVTQYIKLRYRLLPTIYSAAKVNHDTGVPILRRLDLYYPQTPSTALDTEYLLGDSLLVAPMLQPLVPVSPPIPASMFPNGLSAQLFDNPTLNGEPILQRTDANVNFDWGNSAPDPKVPQTNFSVIWTGSMKPVTVTGDYIFAVTSDDGARLFINGNKIIDDWGPEDGTTRRATVHLNAGQSILVRLEYQQLGGGAFCKLEWLRPTDLKVNASRSVWLPPGQWNNLWTGKIDKGNKWVVAPTPLNQCPMWMKSGNFVFLAPPMQFTSQKPIDPITIDAYLGTRDTDYSANYYEDDGISNQYRQGNFANTKVQIHALTNKISVKISPRMGGFLGEIPNHSWILKLHLAKGKHIIGSATLNGMHLKTEIMPTSGTSKPIVLEGAGYSGPSLSGQTIQIFLGRQPSQKSETLILRTN